jgi:hypothetical protein
MHSENQLTDEHPLKYVIASLTALVNEADGDDDRKLDSFQYDLTSMLADVAGEMAFRKKIPEDSHSLYFFLYEAQRLTHRLERCNTLQETMKGLVEYVDTEFGPLGKREVNENLYEMYRLVSEVAFTNGRESDLLFATKFFFAFIR